MGDHTMNTLSTKFVTTVTVLTIKFRLQTMAQTLCNFGSEKVVFLVLSIFHLFNEITP
jgi:hypothetical protein